MLKYYTVYRTPDCGVKMKGEIEMTTVSSDYAVQMHGITKRFGAFYALKDMNLDVKKGSIHSILG